MQRIEKILGFRIKVSEYLPARRLSSIGGQLAEVARQNGLDPDDYCVYWHNLSITPTTPRFLKGTELHERVHSVVIGFFINQKQRRNRKLVFANHFFRGMLKPDHHYADYGWIQYTISGRELEQLGTFSNQLITFIHRSLPMKHRKIKVALIARPTNRLPEQLRKDVKTMIDIRYERLTSLGTLKTRSSIRRETLQINGMSRPVRVFVSYSHQDSDFLKKKSLLGYLSGMEGVTFWVDQRLNAGDCWDDRIKEEINRADIALVLVSQAFLNSKYCQDQEVARFLEFRRNSGLRIFPILLSPCDLESHPWLAALQSEPRGGKTIRRDYRDRGRRDELFLEIRKQLREMIEAIGS